MAVLALAFTGFLPAITNVSRVFFLSYTGFDWVHTRFDWVPLAFTGFDWV